MHVEATAIVMSICECQLSLPSKLVGGQFNGYRFPHLALARVYLDSVVVSNGAAVVFKQHSSGEIGVSGLHSLRSNLLPHYVSGLGIESANNSSGESKMIIHLTSSQRREVVHVHDMASRDQTDACGTKRKGDRNQASTSADPDLAGRMVTLVCHQLQSKQADVSLGMSSLHDM